jgi:hypothetical protein
MPVTKKQRLKNLALAHPARDEYFGALSKKQRSAHMAPALAALREARLARRLAKYQALAEATAAEIEKVGKRKRPSGEGRTSVDRAVNTPPRKEMPG